MEKVIGIDLGTTNSCVAIVENGTSTVLPNKGSYDTTPSIVAIAETGRRLVGHMAKRQAITNASNTAFAFKRLIGRKWDSAEVNNLITTLPYQITEGKNGDVRILLKDRKYTISELSSFILEEMKNVAEEYTGETITKAIITVPAYFSDSQRQATKDAGKIAGLDVIRIINEPTSAALAYGFGKDIESRVAIYDLGGGTFDISVLDIGNGVFEVITTAGDSLLGGEDFDRRIMDWLVFNFAKDHHIDLRKDKMALQRLKDISEKSKCELSAINSTEINLPFIISTGKSDPFHLQTSLSRDKLEQLTGDLVDRTIRICDESLKRSGVDLNSIDQVILVGGMTRMPLVRQKVSEYFQKEPNKGVHPDEVVALGAAIQGNSLTGDSESKNELLLLDVTPYSLGIKMDGGNMYKLIEANTTIPTSSRHVFTNIRDNQSAVNIIVYQGEDEKADNNELLGEFTLTGLRKVPKGELDIEVSFDIDANGIVKVTAKDLLTGKEQAIKISASSKLSEEEINSIIEKNKQQHNDLAPLKNNITPAASVDSVPVSKPPKAFTERETGKTDLSNKKPSRKDTGFGFKSQMGSSGFGSAFQEKADSNIDATIDFKSKIKKTNENSSNFQFGAKEQSINSNTIQPIIDEISIMFPKIETLIKDTPYGPEALRKARETISKSTTVDINNESEVMKIKLELDRTLNMFKTIMMRMSSK